MITLLEDDAILPHMFDRKLDAAKWLVGEMKHDEVKILYLMCREVITNKLIELRKKQHEHV